MPDEIRLNLIAERMEEDADELRSTWADSGAGHIWVILARKLRIAADAGEKFWNSI